MKAKLEVLEKKNHEFNGEDLPALEAYNVFMESHYKEINHKLREDLSDDPMFGPILKAQTVEEQKTQQAHSRKLEREAILENKWKAHSDHLLHQGVTYARLGLKFSDWFRVVKLYRDKALPIVIKKYAKEIAILEKVLDGMNYMVDLGLSIIAESYFIEKNALVEKEQKAKESARKDLRKSESRFKALFENSPDQIFMVDRNYIIQYINHVPPELKKDKVVGTNLLDLQTETGRKVITKAITSVFKTGKATTYEHELPLPEGSRYYSSSVAPIFQSSKVVSAALISRDTTQQVKAEQEARKLNLELEKRVEERTNSLVAINKELDSFTYTVAHDLRTPVRAIDGFARILGKKLAGRIDEKETHYLNNVLEGSKKMGHLIDDLLAFSRMGRTEKNITRFSLELLFQQVFKDLTMNQDIDRIDFSMESLPEIKADREMLKLAIANILGNAIKYSSTRDRAFIEVKCNERNNRFEIEVCDNGVGFEMEYRHKIFEIFQRLHTDDEFEGSGVGLAIVKKVINRHGGDVWVSSELDKGTQMFFSISK